MLKPMLACEAPAVIKFPVIASAKLDGIRATLWDGLPATRSLKPIPNAHINATFAAERLTWNLDGELIIGEPNAKDVYTQTVSGVMSKDGTPDFTFYVFDFVPQHDDSLNCADRFHQLEAQHRFELAQIPFVRLLEQRNIMDMSELLAFEQEQLALGYEGLILRNPESRYKHGRSTAKEGSLLKLKRFTDSEAEIIGFEELMHNDNEATINELGRTQRSTHKANLRPAGTLGALVCKRPDGVEFNIGTGFTAELRAQLWEKRQGLIGDLAKYKHFEIGAKDAPRFPVFLGFRSALDL